MPHPATEPRQRLSWSVRTRILAAILVVTAVGLAISGFTAYAVQRERILEAVDAKLLHSVDMARAISLGNELPPDAEAVEDTETGADSADSEPGAEAEPNAELAAEVPTFQHPEEVLATILSRVLPDANESSLGLIDGTPRYLSAADISFHLEDDPVFLDRVIDEVADKTVRMGTFIGDLGRLRYVAVPVEVEGVDSTGVFVTAFDLDAELGDLNTAFTTYTWVALGTLIAVGVVGWFVAGRLLRPVRVLRDTASRITASDLSERIPVTGNDDLSALTRTVNGMLERIDESVAAQKRLLADVRHELKTPVTIVRGHLELLDAHDSLDVETTRELLLDELDRMTLLIDDIALLVDADRLAFEPEEVRVADFMHQIHQKCVALSGHEWTLTATARSTPDTVWADPARLTQAMLQLADNAVKYAATSPVIELGYVGGSDEAQFWVADHGPGIPAEHQTRIFERFGRVDEGRGIHGSGLGLAIVQAIAVSHGGRVTLDSSPNGSTFTIKIPKTR